MELDRKITIEHPVRTANSYGEPVEVWEAFAVLWANVNHKGGREGFYARQVIAQGDVVFKVRYTAGVTPLMRVKYDGQIYNIIAVAEVGRKAFLEISSRCADNERDS